MRALPLWSWFGRLLVLGVFSMSVACGPDAPADDVDRDGAGDVDLDPSGGLPDDDGNHEGYHDDGYPDEGDQDDTHLDDGVDEGGDVDDGNGDVGDSPGDGDTGDGDEHAKDDGKGGDKDDGKGDKEVCKDVCKDHYCPKDDAKWCEWKGDCEFELEISPVARLAAYWIGLRPFFKMEDVDDLDVELLAKAPYDECYAGVGVESPPIEFENGEPICPESSQPKRNEAYVWGLTKVGDNVIFGTAPNVHCLVMDVFLGLDTPIETDAWVCELGLRDRRPASVYFYNVELHELFDVTPDPATEPLAHARISAVSGLRSAGSIGDIAFLAGPSLGRIFMFAYDGTTGEFLGSADFQEYDDIREWITVKGQLYTGVGVRGAGGAVLRWSGDPADLETLFDFETVGVLPGSAANLAFHEGRLFIASWPRLGTPLGLFMSPLVPYEGGLSEAEQDAWEQVWSITEYEVDPLLIATTGGGAIESYKGHLYWGTMHVPGLAMRFARESLGLDLSDPQVLLATHLGTHRAIALFRGKNFGTNKENVQLVYGEKYLPRYDPTVGSYTIARSDFHLNRMACPTPLWGPSGLGNFFNNYLWAMSVYKEELYFGTMDHSGLYLTLTSARFPQEPENEELGPEGEPLTPMHDYDEPICPDDPKCPVPDDPEEYVRPFFPVVGGDLFRISECDGKAAAAFLDGVGNPMNYGIRTLISDDALYVGSANPMNLHPDGGWELLRLTKPHCDETEDGCETPDNSK